MIDDISFYDLWDSVGTDLEYMASAIVDEEECIKDEICEFDENLEMGMEMGTGNGDGSLFHFFILLFKVLNLITL